jgi:hypothetical protein
MLRVRIAAGLRREGINLRPSWKPQSLPGPTDATGAHDHLGPYRCLPGRLGDLPARQAPAGRDRLNDADAIHSPGQVGAVHGPGQVGAVRGPGQVATLPVAVTGHADANCADHVNESGD